MYYSDKDIGNIYDKFIALPDYLSKLAFFHAIFNNTSHSYPSFSLSLNFLYDPVRVQKIIRTLITDRQRKNFLSKELNYQGITYLFNVVPSPIEISVYNKYFLSSFLLNEEQIDCIIKDELVDAHKGISNYNELLIKCNEKISTIERAFGNNPPKNYQTTFLSLFYVGFLSEKLHMPPAMTRIENRYELFLHAQGISFARCMSRLEELCNGLAAATGFGRSHYRLQQKIDFIKELGMLSYLTRKFTRRNEINSKELVAAKASLLINEPEEHIKLISNFI